MNRLQITTAATIALLSCVPSRDAFRLPDLRAQAGASYKYGNTVDVGEVDRETMIPAARRFKELAEGGAKNITLRIDSFGGSIFLGARWIKYTEDIKRRNGVRVTCIVDGAAYSMGAVILQSSLCDERLATSRSTVLFHNGSTGAEGTAEDLRQSAEFLEALNLAMALVVSERIGMDLGAYQARIAHGDWMMAVPEASRMNVIDGVVSSSLIAPPEA